MKNYTTEWIVVLADGETYTASDGCYVAKVSIPEGADGPDGIDDALQTIRLYNTESATAGNGVSVIKTDDLSEEG